MYGWAGYSGSTASARSPRLEKLWTLVRRSANVCAVESERLSKVRM